MKTPQQEHQCNLARLQAYRAKQNQAQRRRADIAERISTYARHRDLSLLQTSETIRIALSLLDIGLTEAQALKAGTLATDLIAHKNAKQLSHTQKPSAYLLH